MAESPAQTGPIAVYGATGYTGKLVCAELARHGADFVVSGRNQAKLDALAASLGGAARAQAASLGDPASLRSLLSDCAAVIACAGPFTLHGEPVLAAAVDTATHYIDTTGEQPFMRMVFDRYGPRAQEAGVALVTAMGFDYVPGDMIASLTAAGMGPLDEIVLAYALRGFGATRGTTLSALEMLKGGDVEYRNGTLVPADQGVSRGTFEFPPPIGSEPMIRYPAGEQITVPHHVETRNVRTLLSAGSIVPNRLLAAAIPVMMPALGMAMRTPARRALHAMVARLPEGPDPSARSANRFTIVCEARAGSLTRRGVIRGGDGYGLTGATTALAAVLTTSPGYDKRGALAPSQAFDPHDYLAALDDRFEIAYEVDPLPVAETAVNTA